MPDARLHDRREPQPQGPARGPDPGHRRHPGRARPGAVRQPRRPGRRAGGQRPRPGRRGAAPRRSAPTCGRSWPRPAAATAPPSTRSPPTGPSGYRRGDGRRAGAATPSPPGCSGRRAAGDGRRRRRLRRVVDPGVPGRPRRRPPAVEVVHRHAPRPGAGRRRAPALGLGPPGRRDGRAGLAAALDAGPVASIGVDTWGVDYGLLDDRGELVAPPFSYRDDRTAGYRDGRRPRRRPAALYATHRASSSSRSTRSSSWRPTTATSWPGPVTCVLLPELLVHHLTGEIAGRAHERRDDRAGRHRRGRLVGRRWPRPSALDPGAAARRSPPAGTRGRRVARHPGPPGRRPRHRLGGGGHGRRAGPHGVRVGRDVAARRPRAGRRPTSARRRRRGNFTNEIGALGGVRFLKNLAGSWLIEGCRPAWGDPPVDDLLAWRRPPSTRADALLDVADPRFLHPADMLAEVTGALGLPVDAPPPVVVGGIVESQAAGTARRARPARRRSTTSPCSAAASGRRCTVVPAGRAHAAARSSPGPVEATALGNALVQGIALGVYADLADARAHLAPTTSGARLPTRGR